MTISVRVQPGASSTEVVGWSGGVLWLRVQAPALDGRANWAVIELLAAVLGLPRSALSVQRGVKTRNKVLQVETSAPETVLERLGTPGAKAP
ncbi:MAG: DUF167 domain-containing protein [Dehalococcoidia bacterium]|nr:DUF167 domain-containing protein [Dehalococcoidia bacterium]